MIAAVVAGGTQHSDTVVELDQTSAGPQRASATGSGSRRAVNALRSPVEKE